MPSQKKVDGKICDYKPMLNQKMFNAEVEEFIRYMVAGMNSESLCRRNWKRRWMFLLWKLRGAAAETTETGTRVETETDTDVGSLRILGISIIRENTRICRTGWITCMIRWQSLRRR